MRSTESPDTDLTIASTLLVYRPRTRREWAAWYATQRAARVALQRRQRPDLIDMYGLDPDSIAAAVTRWDGPALPDGLFWAWFGVPRRRRAGAA